jgi:hypothetical protein
MYLNFETHLNVSYVILVWVKLLGLKISEAVMFTWLQQIPNIM